MQPSSLLPSPNLHLDQQGYVLKIVGGQDKQGFAMKQGVLTNQRVRLLMTPGDQGFRGYGRRNGTCGFDKDKVLTRDSVPGHEGGRFCVSMNLKHGEFYARLVSYWAKNGDQGLGLTIALSMRN